MNYEFVGSYVPQTSSLRDLVLKWPASFRSDELISQIGNIAPLSATSGSTETKLAILPGPFASGAGEWDPNLSSNCYKVGHSQERAIYLTSGTTALPNESTGVQESVLPAFRGEQRYIPSRGRGRREGTMGPFNDDRWPS